MAKDTMYSMQKMTGRGMRTVVVKGEKKRKEYEAIGYEVYSFAPIGQKAVS